MVWYGATIIGSRKTLDAFFEMFVSRNLHIRASDYKQTVNGLEMELFSFQRFGFSRNFDPNQEPCACVCAQRQPPPIFEAVTILQDHGISVE